jgi:hypothetical protein
MSINTEKTQVMVFRNGGPLRRNEKWFYNGQCMKTTSHYPYLGLLVSCFMKWQKATCNLAMKGMKSVNVIKRFVITLDCHDTRLLFGLFDRMVVPIIMYGSEIWGTEYRKVIEKVQVKFCKFVLGVGSRSPDVCVLGECGRFPLFVKYYVKAVKYWTKLICMDDCRVSKQCYLMLKDLDSHNRHNWVTSVKNLLFKYGYGYIWIAQEIGDVSEFIYRFEQCVKDCALQEWHSAVETSTKLELSHYSEYKTLLNTELYLYVIPQVSLRRCLARFRCSSHNLAIERGRAIGVNRSERYCLYCQLLDVKVVEDEFHFVCMCPLYADLRARYLPYLCDIDSFVSNFNSQSTTTILNLCHFLYESFKLCDAMLH